MSIPAKPVNKSSIEPSIFRSLSTHNQSITEEHELEEYLGSFNKSADESILSTSVSQGQFEFQT